MFTQLRFTIVEISYFKHLGNMASLEFQYLRISCLLNPYSKQLLPLAQLAPQLAVRTVSFEHWGSADVSLEEISVHHNM